MNHCIASQRLFPSRIFKIDSSFVVCAPNLSPEIAADGRGFYLSDYTILRDLVPALLSREHTVLDADILLAAMDTIFSLFENNLIEHARYVCLLLFQYLYRFGADVEFSFSTVSDFKEMNFPFLVERFARQLACYLPFDAKLREYGISKKMLQYFQSKFIEQQFYWRYKHAPCTEQWLFEWRKNVAPDCAMIYSCERGFEFTSFFERWVKELSLFDPDDICANPEYWKASLFAIFLHREFFSANGCEMNRAECVAAQVWLRFLLQESEFIVDRLVLREHRNILSVSDRRRLRARVAILEDFSKYNLLSL